MSLIVEGEYGKIELDPWNGTFDLDVTIGDRQLVTIKPRMTVDEVIDMAVNLVGPMVNDEPGLVKKFLQSLKDRGFI